MARIKPTHLTVMEAQRAIYIDFEGRENEPPAFLGVLCADEFIQYVMDPELWPAAEAKDADPMWTWECRPATWADLSEIRIMAESEHRRIIAFSEREQIAIAEHIADDADRDWFVTNIVNARPIAVGWKARFYPEVVFVKNPNRRSRGINRLELFLELIDYPVPPIHGSGNSAARIRYVREKLASRQGDYINVTQAAKTKWTNGLKHNHYDCEGLRELMLCAAEGRATC